MQLVLRTHREDAGRSREVRRWVTQSALHISVLRYQAMRSRAREQRVCEKLLQA